MGGNTLNINVECPACGAVLNLQDTTRRTTCEFCGNNFDVDPTKTEPVLQRITPEEMIADPIPVQSAETESVIPPPAPPRPVETFTAPPPRSVPTPTIPGEPTKRNWLWIGVAILVGLLAFGVCGVMLLIRVLMGI